MRLDERAARSSRLRLALFGLLVGLCSSLMGGTSASAQDASVGRISGRVSDTGSGAPIENATIILERAAPGDGEETRQEIAASGPDGRFEFAAVPAGSYALRIVKSGYRPESTPEVRVLAGQASVQDFAMTAEDAAAEVVEEADGEIEEFVVEAAIMDELLQGLAMRTEADMQLDLMSAEDLSKYAASDVADALKRVPGVSVVEGQFAIIRGLEDRYSSTTFNGAPVPSPDPNRQSVQLDLFPADVVSNLAVAKTFAAETPSNSSGGSIDIETRGYPEVLTLKLSVGSGFEEGAERRFLEYESGSTVGRESDPTDIIESDVAGLVGGQSTLFDRAVRFKAAINHEIDYRSEEGFQESREPRLPGERSSGGQITVIETRGLALGQLELSDGRFDQIQSTRDEQLTGFAALGIDFDEEGSHRVDATYFHTDDQQETVELRENGFFRDLDYSNLITATENGDLNSSVLQDEFAPVATFGSRLGARALREQLDDTPARGALWFANFGRSNSFERERDLDVYQLNGEHDLDLFEGLKVTWAANHAASSLDDSSRGMRFFYEPCGFSPGFECPAGNSPIPIPTAFPTRVGTLGPGTFMASGTSGGIVDTETNVEEKQFFARLDAEQDITLADFVDLNLKTGFWWEQSDRDVDATFVESVTVAGSSQWLLAEPSLSELGGTLFDRFDSATGVRTSQTDASREITAGHFSAKLTFLEDFDVLGGLRYENIFIDSQNSPFTGEIQLNRPATFPTAYLFFDRLDNPNLGEVSPTADLSNVVFNDQILGINTPINPDTGFVDLLDEQQILALTNGEIDETKALPSAGLAYRPIDGVVLRASFSQTVARPSFREMGYYVTVEPGTDERTVGNPQLGISEVESYDVRGEYMFGELGDLVAFSAFYKVIDDPIESIIVRNPLDLDSGAAALFRTFFNNPNTARLWGIEMEARRSFDFLRQLGLDFPGIDAFDYLSIGGNFTYIEAEVARTEAELSRAQRFFGVAPGDTARYSGLERERRLFGQPEWIGNADVTFNHPDWGTTFTLAVFALSDVLDAAGTAAIGPDRVNPVALSLDRYLDDFYQLDLVASQRIWQGLTAKMSVKNLTDTPRRRFYDRQQTSRTYVERSRKYGRDWSFSLGYTVEY